MDTVKFNRGNVKMIAHRGVSGLECENSISAFVAAGNRSYYGIEADVHMTRDGKFVIIHDDNIKRVTGLDRVVEKSTLKEIREGKLISLPYGAGERRSDLVIPELEEYIQVCRHYNKTAVLEIKNPMPESAVMKICSIITQNDCLGQTIFISFDWENIGVIKKVYPEQRVQFLTRHCDEALMEKLTKNGFDVDILYIPHWTESLLKSSMKEILP